MSDVELDLPYDDEIEDEDYYDVYNRNLTPGNLLYLDMMDIVERTSWLQDPMVTDLELLYKRDFIETLGWLFDGVLEEDPKRLDILEQVNSDLNKLKAIRTVH